jgi:LysR family nitrogen assimilation transcriptional regulator
MPLPLDLRLLWYFKRTAEIGSLTKAAEELRTSQSALTRHIMRLEHELRATLLLRDQRGVTPTEAGALVLDKAENLLRLEQAMKDDIGALSRTIAGDLALCMPSSMHWVVTAPMTSVVAAKFPDIRLRLMDGFDHLVRAQLKSRSADIGVIVHDPDSILDGVDCRPVATEQLCLIGSTPPAIPPGPVHLAKIAGLPLILPSGQNILRRRLDLAFRRAHLSADIIAGFETQLRELTAAGAEKVFQEQVSSVAARAQLDAALDFVRECGSAQMSRSGSGASTG